MSSSTNSFYVTGGTLRLDAPSYVERQADRDLFESLLQGELCYVLTSRQMGKSSLMVRTANKLRSQGAHVIALDLSAIGQNLTPAQWYNGLLTSMGDQLGLEDELEEFWIAKERLSPVQRWFASIRKAVLARRSGKVVIFLDEIDTVRSLPFSTDEFFAAIRGCYNRRSEDPEFNRLTFCLLGVAIPSDLISDTRITPFNVGRRIELNDFTSEEAVPLARGLHSAPTVSVLLKRVLYWTSGHPYLTQRLCQALARNKEARRAEDVDRLCEELFFSNRARERDDNLIFVRERILRSEADLAGLLRLYLKVRSGERVADDETNPLVSILLLSGIVRSEQGCLIERNLIYYQVFDRVWARANLPEAETRRQRAAFRRGVTRTSVVALFIVVMMGMMVIAVREKRSANLASAQAFVSQVEATLVSGYQGQRIQSLEAVNKATAVYPDKTRLRNLAITSLALMDLRPGHKWAGYPVSVSNVALNLDFNLYARGDPQGEISIRSVAKDEEQIRLPGAGLAIDLLLFSPNSRYLAVKYKLGSTNELTIWDWRNRSAILRLPHQVNRNALDFSPDSRRVGFGQPDGTIRIYSLETGTLTQQLASELPTHQPRPPNCLRFHSSENLLAESCDVSSLVQIWDLDSATVRSTNYHRGPVLDLAWHPDGDLLAAACRSGEIYLWDRRIPRTSRVLGRHEAEVTRVSFSHQGDLLASGSKDQTLRLWVPFTGRQMICPLEHGQLMSLNFSLDDQQLGFSRVGSDIQLWDVKPARECRVLLAHVGTSEELENIAFSPDGRLLAGAGNDGIVLWDPVRGKRLLTLSEVSTRSAFFDPTTGDLMASSSVFGFRRWPLRPAENVRPPQPRLGPVSARDDLPDELGPSASSADGRTSAVIHGHEVLVFSPSDSGVRSTLRAETRYDALAISPDGKYIAARATQENQIHLWEVSGGARVSILPPIAETPYFGFSPDGEWFVTGSLRTFDFRPLTTWQPAFQLTRSGNQPGPMAFSRDGKLFAMSVSVSAIELVQLPRGESLARLESPDRRPLRALAFSPDGRKLAAASSEQLVLIWDLSLLAQELSQLKLQGKLRVYPESQAP